MIVVVMGVAGVGKTTVGKRLAAALGWEFHDADDFNGLDTDDPNAIAAAAAPLGIDRDMILAGIADPEVKIIARQQGEQAVARGVFGSPWIFVDGEPFWGNDRLPMVERWLEGPW